MIGELFLIAALIVSFIAALVFGVADGQEPSKRGRQLVIVAFIATLAAAAALMYFIFANRFDIAYVAGYSSTTLPAVYKFSAFWAGQQGSFLLWLFIHAAAGCWLAFGDRMKPAALSAYMTIQALIGVLVLAKSPFEIAQTVATEGVGLNPLLQDPWMAIHPPIIFIGYAMLAIPFAYSIGALIKKPAGREWLEPARRAALIAWGFLGAGIFIGGYWAYKVLGWGGFWGWDPVENSSLVPWLIATVFVHVLKVARMRENALSLVHLAAVFAFSLVLYGTFLTRSGILGDFSVHSFAGTSIGLVIAVVNAAVLIFGLFMIAYKAKRIPQGVIYESFNTCEFILLLGMLFVVFIACVIFMGMSMPLLTQLVGKPASVDNVYYVHTTMPLAIVMMMAMTSSCLRLYGKDRKLPRNFKLAVFPIIGIIAPLAVGVREVMPIVLAGAAMMGLSASFYRWQRKALSLGGFVAHLGLSISLVAIVLAGNGSQSTTQELAVNEPVQLYGHQVTYLGQRFDADGKAKHYVYNVDGSEVAALTKLHADGNDAAREPAIAKSLTGDVYIAPTPAKSGATEELILKRGKRDVTEQFDFRYEGVEIKDMADGSGKVIASATILVTDGEKVEEVKPFIVATENGGTSQPIAFMDGKARMRLTGISADQKNARIEIWPSQAEESQLPVTASVSTKPFIWILWVGSIVLCLGCLLAAKK